MKATNRFAYCLMAVLLFTMTPRAFGDSTNMLEIPPGKSVSFATPADLDLSAEGSIEFWYRHQSDHTKQKAFAQKNFLDDAYSVVMTVGTGKDQAMAVVIGPGVEGQASIGVVTDLSVLGNNEKLRASMVRLSRVDDAGKRDPIELVKGSVLYHVLLARRPGRNEFRVFFNGSLQGSIEAKLPRTVGLPIVLGYTPPAKKADAPPDAEEPAIFPFDGFLGGLRLWRTGEFEETDAVRLADFGRTVDVADLTALPEYGHLSAYSDFTGRRWSPQRMNYVAGAEPRLKFADPLAGAWFLEGATVEQTKANSSVFDDYAVFTFVPATATVLPVHRRERVYSVFEDGNYIGSMYTLPDREVETWQFRHADGWQPVDIEHAPFNREWMLQWSLKNLPEGKSFAGAMSGTIRLKRRTTVDMGIKSLATGRMTPEEIAKRAKSADSMSLVFLYTAYPEFFDRLYGSYNIVKMSPRNLFNTGVETTEKAIRVPDADQMLMHLGERMIMPYDLGVVQTQLALDKSTTKLVSTASDYNAALTSRIGAGVSGSVTAGVGGITGVTLTGTLNMNVVMQAETVKELARQSSDSTEKLIRNKWDNKYTLHHKKDVIRLSDKYADALRALHAQCAASSPDGRRQLVFAFFDKWGTHYVFAAVFGSLEFSETVISDVMRAETASKTTSFEVSINEGKTGDTRMQKDGKTEQLKNTDTVTHSFGSDQKPVPIALDLRPLHDLLTPNHFPDEPHLYIEMRHLLGHLLGDYRGYALNGEIKKMDAATAAKAERINKEIQSPPPRPKFDILAVRYLGFSYTHTDPKVEFVNRSREVWGSITFVPSVIAADGIELPASLRQEARDFLAANPPVVIVPPIKHGVDQPRMINPTSKIQPFGEAKATQVVVKLPQQSKLKDYVYVRLQGEFTEGMGIKELGNINGLPTAATIDGGTAIALHLTQNNQPRVKGTNTVLVRVKGKDYEFDDWFRYKEDMLGSFIWANFEPLQLDVTKNLFPSVGLTGMEPGKKWFSKQIPSRNGDGTFGMNNFMLTQNGNWKQGVVSLTLGEARIEGKKPSDSPYRYNIHYESALLPDFKEAAAAPESKLLNDSWGNFSPGVETPEVNLLANRSTANLRLPPTAPLSDALTERVKLAGDKPIAGHIMMLQKSDPFVGLASRGWGNVGFLPSGQAEGRWTFVERNRGEWMILSLIDGRVLTAVDVTSSTVGQPPRDNDDFQLWIPESLSQNGTIYKFRNKKNKQYLCGPSTADGPAGLATAEDTAALTTFQVLPGVMLEPNSQLNIARAADVARADTAIGELNAAIEATRVPVDGLDQAAHVQLQWTSLLAIADQNRNGKVDDAELEGSPQAKLFGKSPEDYQVYVKNLLEAERKKGKDDRQINESLVQLTKGFRQLRVMAATEPAFKELELNSDGGLDAAESRPLLAMPALAGVTFDSLDADKNRKLDVEEVRAAIAAAVAKPPTP